MAEPHTDTEHDSGASLAIALIGLFLIAALLVVPWFVGDGWDGAWGQTPQGQPFVVVQGTPVPTPARAKSQQARGDAPPQYYSDLAPDAQPLTPDLSQLPSVKS